MKCFCFFKKKKKENSNMFSVYMYHDDSSSDLKHYNVAGGTFRAVMLQHNSLSYI